MDNYIEFHKRDDDSIRTAINELRRRGKTSDKPDMTTELFCKKIHNAIIATRDKPLGDPTLRIKLGEGFDDVCIIWQSFAGYMMSIHPNIKEGDYNLIICSPTGRTLAKDAVEAVREANGIGDWMIVDDDTICAVNVDIADLTDKLAIMVTAYQDIDLRR